MRMDRMVIKLHLLLGILTLCFLTIFGLTSTGQETVHVVNLHEPKPPSFKYLSYARDPDAPPIGVTLGETDLTLVSSSVLAAEEWLKSHVLSHYPSANISTVVVGRGVLCNRSHENQWSLVLPSVKNVHYSLVRWGLTKEIKLSAAFSSHCFNHSLRSPSFRSDLVELLSFLQEHNLVYSIDPPHPHSSPSSESPIWVFSFHQDALEKLGFAHIKDIKVIGETKPMIMRKLSSLSTPSFLERSKPGRNLNPPPLQFAPVPEGSLSFAPDVSPPEIPSNPTPAPTSSDVPSIPPIADVLPPPTVPEVPAMAPIWTTPDAPPSPPCLAPSTAPVPGTGEGQKVGLWCVAKPTVPAEKLEEAIDYACGAGGADCEEIGPNGRCYYPDNVVAHASYAYNSYWQRTKKSGGTCSFDGTALLINSDPSFLQCHFALD